jgi:hypothetical protein
MCSIHGKKICPVKAEQEMKKKARKTAHLAKNADFSQKRQSDKSHHASLFRSDLPDLLRMVNLIGRGSNGDMCALL